MINIDNNMDEEPAADADRQEKMMENFSSNVREIDGDVALPKD